MKTYPVRYFDGKSSFAHKATLCMKEDCWLLEYEIKIPIPQPETNEQLEPTLEEDILPAEENVFSAPSEEIIEPASQEEVPAFTYEKKEVRWELAQIHKRETISKTNTFYYGDFPYASVECDDATFIDDVEALYPQFELVNKRYSRLFRMGAKGVAMIGGALITTLVLVYFFVLPPFAESAIVLVPQAYEQNMGDGIFETLTSHQRSDAELTNLVNKFAQNIDFGTSYNIRITVINDATVNAFAVPGGRIVVYTGLLDRMKNYEELAALLGHEVAHVHQRHSLKAMARAFAGYLFMSAIFTDINGMTATITENVQFLQTMRYSRSAEAEADEKAVEVLRKNNISLQGLIDLFVRLEHDHDHSDLDEALSFVSSHPQTKDRKAFAQRQASTQKISEKKEVLENIWKQIKSVEK
jgi:Zn-dependent protease with chaperone function